MKNEKDKEIEYNDKDLALRFILDINHIEGFPIDGLSEKLYDSNTGAETKMLPLKVKKAWFRAKYSNGHFTKIIEEADNEFAAVTVRVYADQSEEAWIGEATECYTFNDENNEIPIRERKYYNIKMARGLALSAALTESGFGMGYWSPTDEINNALKLNKDNFMPEDNKTPVKKGNRSGRTDAVVCSEKVMKIQVLLSDLKKNETLLKKSPKDPLLLMEKEKNIMEYNKLYSEMGKYITKGVISAEEVQKYNSEYLVEKEMDMLNEDVKMKMALNSICNIDNPTCNGKTYAEILKIDKMLLYWLCTSGKLQANEVWKPEIVYLSVATPEEREKYKKGSK